MTDSWTFFVNTIEGSFGVGYGNAKRVGLLPDCGIWDKCFQKVRNEPRLAPVTMTTLKLIAAGLCLGRCSRKVEIQRREEFQNFGCPTNVMAGQSAPRIRHWDFHLPQGTCFKLQSTYVLAIRY